MANTCRRATAAPVPIFERQRLEALHSTNLLDGEPNARFDKITVRAASDTSCPMALVTFVDKEHIELKSRVGISNYRMKSRRSSLCSHAILLPVNEVMVVLDTHLDRRFIGNSTVFEEPFIRFYAGTPLTTPEGHHIGSLCVLDTCPRSEFTSLQKEALVSLAKEANNEIKSAVDAQQNAPINSLDAHLGKRLKQARARQHILQIELAGRLGISAIELENMEIGRSRIPTPLLLTLSQLLEVPTKYFFRGL